MHLKLQGASSGQSAVKNDFVLDAERCCWHVHMFTFNFGDHWKVSDVLQAVHTPSCPHHTFMA